MSLARRVGLAAALLLACSREVPVPDDAQLTCAASADCPSGFLCHAGMCQRADAIDTTPPDLAAPPVVSPVVGKAGTTFTIDLLASEPLAEPPRVTLGLDAPVVRTCASTGGTGYRCSYQPTGAENGGKGGTVGFDVWLKDLGRNETSRKLAGVLRLDFDAPRVTTASVAYFPAPANPLPAVSRATGGTVVRVAVNADELLDASTLPSLAATSGAATLTFAVVPGTLSGDGAVFEAEVPGNLPDGDYLATVSWSDVAGNAADVEIATPAIRVKTSRPTLTIDQSQVTYVRSPWGNAADETIGGRLVPAGPFFELAPADTFSGASTLPATTFSAGTATAAAVRVWGDAGLRSLLGTLRPDTDGSWPRARLVNMDAPAVWATIVDDAGNESDPGKVVNVEWIATPNPPPFGASPHALEASFNAAGSAVPEQATSAGARPELGGLDAIAFSITAHPRIVQRLASSDSPSARSKPSLVHDPVRGRTVLVGGEDATGYPQGTWEWDGSTWVQASDAGQAIGSSTIAFDSARGRVVQWDEFAAERREWDGSSWTERAFWPGPNFDCVASDASGIAYDSIRDRMVLFDTSSTSGNCDLVPRTLEWDGNAWVERGAPGAGPGTRFRFAVTFDPSRGVVVMFGGSQSWNSGLLDELWEYDGVSGTWTLAPQAGAAPGPRVDHALVYDPALRRVLLVGGSDGAGRRNDVRAWDGTSWTDLTPAAPSPVPRALLGAAVDTARGALVVFGGESATGAFLGDTWELSASRWLNATPAAATAPPPTRGQAMAFDPVRRRVVLYGGLTCCPCVISSDVWEWDGRTWSKVTPSGASPPGRMWHAMAWNPDAQRMVVFGGAAVQGCTGNFGGTYVPLADVWEWDGASWTQRTYSGPAPSPRFEASMSYDTVRHAMIVTGGSTTWTGYGTSDALGDVWTLSRGAGGALTWAPVPVPASFGTRYNGCQVFDGTRTLVFGGLNASGSASWKNTSYWSWDGSTWTELTPGARYWGWSAGAWYDGTTTRSTYAPTDAPVAWDAARRRAVSFGTNTFVEVSWSGGDREVFFAPPISFPDSRSDHAMAFDEQRGRIVLFGGQRGASAQPEQDTWEWDEELVQTTSGPVQRRAPMVQFTVSYGGAGWSASDVRALRVRARAGGAASSGGSGAELLGWKTGGPAEAPGAWVELAANGEAAPLAAAPAGMLEWSSAPDDVRRFLVQGDSVLAFQLRPAGAPGPAEPESRIAADYIEVRVRYLAP